MKPASSNLREEEGSIASLGAPPSPALGVILPPPICPNCKAKTLKNSRMCVFCGKPLKQEK